MYSGVRPTRTSLSAILYVNRPIREQSDVRTTPTTSAFAPSSLQYFNSCCLASWSEISGANGVTDATDNVIWWVRGGSGFISMACGTFDWCGLDMEGNGN